jgi:hypothetical protein
VIETKDVATNTQSPERERKKALGRKWPKMVRLARRYRMQSGLKEGNPGSLGRQKQTGKKQWRCISWRFYPVEVHQVVHFTGVQPDGACKPNLRRA